MAARHQIWWFCVSSITCSSNSELTKFYVTYLFSFCLCRLEPTSSPELSPRQEGDRLSELSALVNRGERKGLFGDQMPPDIHRVIGNENLQFLRDRAVYNQEYFNFVRSLVTCNLVSRHRGVQTLNEIIMAISHFHPFSIIIYFEGANNFLEGLL